VSEDVIAVVNLDNVLDVHVVFEEVTAVTDLKDETFGIKLTSAHVNLSHHYQTSFVERHVAGGASI
ncbi:20573_t:CDS:2, partial [Gigaspora rosea]